MSHRVETQWGEKTLIIETGKLAKQAGGSVTVQCGDSIVLVTATVAKTPKDKIDFTPLTVDYIEKTFAAGKIPGGFFKREGRPTENATLTSRFIDRPIRPLFPKGYAYETQVIATVLSVDEENEPNILAMIGASTALMLSEAPFQGPIAGVRVGRLDGRFVINPTSDQMEESDIDLIVAGSEDAVVMVEGGSSEVSEEDLVAAIRFAHESIQPILQLQKKLAKELGKDKIEVLPSSIDTDLESKAKKFLEKPLAAAMTTVEKKSRQEKVYTLKDTLIAEFISEEDPSEIKEEKQAMLEKIFDAEQKKFLRQMILEKKKRLDGRGTEDIRNITCEVGLLPRAHGSALFTRGETQALVTTTLGTSDDKQLIDALGESYYKNFLLHYNFPPFSTGEVKFLRSPGRREVGHGALAERSVQIIVPDEEKFPYTVRVVSEILESNGSSSMASVCGATLSLMDAGVPISAPVAGIAMGLVKEGEKYAILSDILGDEDHLGDMDFKVAGTRNGVTALQMDIKISGLSEEILTKALAQAKKGRMHILDIMEKTLAAPRQELSPYAPKVQLIKINKEKIGALIGPGGKMIRSIIAETGANIDVEDDGTVKIFATDQESGDKALQRIRAVTAEAEIGKFYKGRAVRIVDFGVFVEIMPGVDGLVHISQLENKRVERVTDVLQEGDELIVKVLEVDPKNGKIRLSRKEALDYHGDVISYL